jgi:hypothetical protein
MRGTLNSMLTLLYRYSYLNVISNESLICVFLWYAKHINISFIFSLNSHSLSFM